MYNDESISVKPFNPKRPLCPLALHQNTLLDLPRKRDSLGYIVRVDLSEPLPGALHGVLEVLVDPREVDRGYGRREGGLNVLPAVYEQG
jgi:hypothetical protein